MDLRGAALNFDIKRLNPSFLADPFPIYRALREHDPVHRMPDGSYFLSRYDDCDTVYRVSGNLKFGQAGRFQAQLRRQVADRDPLSQRIARGPAIDPRHWFSPTRLLCSPGWTSLRALEMGSRSNFQRDSRWW
jgi:cytochrome P450